MVFMSVCHIRLHIYLIQIPIFPLSVCTLPQVPLPFVAMATILKRIIKGFKIRSWELEKAVYFGVSNSYFSRNRHRTVLQID